MAASVARTTEGWRLPRDDCQCAGRLSTIQAPDVCQGSFWQYGQLWQVHSCTISRISSTEKLTQLHSSLSQFGTGTLWRSRMVGFPTFSSTLAPASSCLSFQIPLLSACRLSQVSSSVRYYNVPCSSAIERPRGRMTVVCHVSVRLIRLTEQRIAGCLAQVETGRQ